MAEPPRVFISYARTDGLEFARHLRERLEGAGISLWQDLVAIQGGRDWWLQIIEALDHVEFIVMVMTPGALSSETCKKEWRYARQRGVCVCPVKAVRDQKLDFASAPRWMNSTHWYGTNLNSHGEPDFPEQWTTLLNDLNRRCEKRRVPFMVDDLPENFVHRPAEFDALINLLRDPKREEPVAMTAALRGAGGFGKTTLARALCHDEHIQEAFDDGILWVTLGESPGDLTVKVLDLIEVLSGERPGFKTPEAAGARLGELLADRDILMVIDDVWSPSDVSPFLGGGKRCARLITTRNRDTIPAQARLVNVDAMGQEEAVALLRGGLPPECDAETHSLAGRLGKWPVLLKLANGVLRDRIEANQTLPDAIAHVNADLDENGLSTFDAADPRQRNRAVAATLAVSLKRVGGDRPRYEELSVFPEDVDVPLSTLERLWGKTGNLSSVKVEKLCQRLYGLSLLLRFDLATRTIRLHNVMRSYLAQKTENAATLHATLVDTWDDLAQLPDDYAWRWVAFHLRESGQQRRLRELLMNFNWLEAKLKATDVTALMADYDLFQESARPQTGDQPVARPGRRIGIPPWSIVDLCEHKDRSREWAMDNEPTGLAQGALRLSAHVLARDKNQLAGQLTGRLIGESSPEIRAMPGRRAGSPRAPHLVQRSLGPHSGGRGRS